MATQGMKPVCAIYSTFLQRAYDPIVHDAALQHLPVLFCLDRAGLAGEDGPTHHGTFDIPYLRHIPGMVVASPRDGNELRDLMFTALAHGEGPFAIRYPKAGAGAFDPEGEPRLLEVGKWEVVRPGREAAILAVGPMVEVALSAADLLKPQGLAVEVVNCRFVKPLDEAYVAERLPSFTRVLTLEEGALPGGFGSAVLEAKEVRGGSVLVLRMGLPDRFITHGPRARLLEDLGLTPEGVARTLTEGWIRKAAEAQPASAAL
jgi:1-deoxy-D-xylulose-5-phosphate synthase